MARRQQQRQRMVCIDRCPGRLPDGCCCAVPIPGHYLDGVAAAVCPAHSFCGGGSRTADPTPCGPHMSSVAGAAAFSDCTVDPGFLWDDGVGAALPCWQDHYCPGGSQSTLPVPCGSDMASATGSWAHTDCGALRCRSRWLLCWPCLCFHAHAAAACGGCWSQFTAVQAVEPGGRMDSHHPPCLLLLCSARAWFLSGQ